MLTAAVEYRSAAELFISPTTVEYHLPRGTGNVSTSWLAEVPGCSGLQLATAVIYPD